MDLKGAYYYFQHKLIPQTFYEDKVKFVNALSAQGASILYSGLKEVLEHFKIENPYTLDMFGVEVMQYSKEVIIIKVSFPEPEDVQFCYCAYMIFDPKCKKQMYFCVEKGMEHSFLCGWTQGNDHINYGSCEPTDNDALSNSIAIYLDNFDLN